MASASLRPACSAASVRPSLPAASASRQRRRPLGRPALGRPGRPAGSEHVRRGRLRTVGLWRQRGGRGLWGEHGRRLWPACSGAGLRQLLRGPTGGARGELRLIRASGFRGGLWRVCHLLGPADGARGGLPLWGGVGGERERQREITCYAPHGFEGNYPTRTHSQKSYNILELCHTRTHSQKPYQILELIFENFCRACWHVCSSWNRMDPFRR